MPALDADTKNKLFGGMKNSGSSKDSKSKTSKEKDLETPKVATLSLKQEDEFKTSKLPKFATLEKVTVLLTSEQKDVVNHIARKLMRFRSQPNAPKEERERITANSVLRALIDNFVERVPSLEMESIQNEDELRAWLKQLFK